METDKKDKLLEEQEAHRVCIWKDGVKCANANTDYVICPGECFEAEYPIRQKQDLSDKQQPQRAAEKWLKENYFDEETGDWLKYDVCEVMEEYAEQLKSLPSETEADKAFHECEFDFGVNPHYVWQSAIDWVIYNYLNK